MASSTQKHVEIKIADSDLETLKHNGYKLCFAKKVNDTFNVVWQSYEKYLRNNHFYWTPVYQIFGTNTFNDSITVSANTNEVNIKLGEQSIMSASGVLQPASTGGVSHRNHFNK